MSPTTVRSQAGYHWRTCQYGVRGIGLYRYRRASDGFDAHGLRIVCRGNYPVMEIGHIPPGSTLVERHNPRTCPGEEKIRGIAIYRYRESGGENRDAYGFGILCHSGGWRYFAIPRYTLISYDSIGNWGTSQPDLRDLRYIKWTTFRDGQTETETFNMDVAFGNLPNPGSGSLVQEMRSYGCMDMAWDGSDPPNVIIWHDCHGGGNQQWYMTPAREIKNMMNSNLCLDQNPFDNNVIMWPCHGGPNQKWVYDHSTSRWSNEYAPHLCLDFNFDANSLYNNLYMNYCDFHSDQQFVFDSYAFATVTGGPL